MNNTSGGRCLDSLTDSPLPNFIRTGGEETGQVQSLAHGNNDLGQGRLGSELLALLLGCGLIAELGQALLEGAGNGDNSITGGIRLNPISDLGEVLVLLANVVLLTEVDEINNGLGGKEEERVDGLDLVQTIIRLSHGLQIARQ